MDTAGSAADFMPNTFISVLSILESEKDRYSWTLSRNQDGFSLLIKSNNVKSKVTANRKVHYTRRAKGCEKRTVKNLDKDSVTTDSANVNIPARPKLSWTSPKLAKHKSPSAIARDKARRKRYRLRKKERRAAKLYIAKKSGLNSIRHHEEENSNCDSERIQTSVTNTVETNITLNTSDLSSLPSASSDSLHQEDCAQSYTAEIDSDDESSVCSEQASVNTVTVKCVHCKKEPIHTDFTCSWCNQTNYCSKACQEADWSWHKFVCKPQTD